MIVAVLSVVYDARRDASHVTVVAAANFTAPALETIDLSARVLLRFDGSWETDASL
jgi:carotenoid cleavage dioxygenase-like enzyme